MGVAKVNKLEGDLNAHRAGQTGGELKATIAEINAAMAKHREEKKSIQERLNALRDERNNKLGDVPKWRDERSEIGKQISEKREKIEEIRDEFKEKENKYYQYLRDVRAAKAKSYEEERQKWQLEREIENKKKKA